MTLSVLTLTVFFAVLLAALLHASWNAVLKGGRDVLLDTALVVAGAGIVMLPFVFVVPLPEPASWPYLASSLVTHVGYYFLMVNAYRTGDLSLVYPLMRGAAPLVAAVLAVFWLREMPAASAWFGMGAISVGVIMLAWRAVDHRPSRAAVGYALANALVIAAYTVIDGAGVRLAGNAWSYIVWLFVVDAVPFTVFVWWRRGRALIDYGREFPLRLFGAGGASAAAYAISVWAMTQAPVALVASLRETSVLFAVMFGVHLLGEKLTWRRWVGVGAVVVGALALKVV